MYSYFCFCLCNYRLTKLTLLQNCMKQNKIVTRRTAISYILNNCNIMLQTVKVNICVTRERYKTIITAPDYLYLRTIY